MKMVRFGKTELMVSEVAFGGIPIMRRTKPDAVELIRGAIDLGVNFIDTAHGYGDSEEKIGEKNYSGQTKLVIIIMAVLIASIFIVYWMVQEQKKFELDGVEFYKQQEGTVTFYNSLLAYVSATGEQVPFILKLRTNPEELAEIPVRGDIQLLDTAVISLSPEMVNCSDVQMVVFDMALTLKAFGTNTTLGTPDRAFAEETNYTLADCRNSLNRSVILFKEANTTEIDQEALIFKNCYIIGVKDCQMREGYERFILRYITDSQLN